MNKALKTFLTDGLKHYWEAASTLRLFEKEVKDLMEQAIRKRTDWHPLRSHKLAVSRAGGGPDGRWIPCLIEGQDSRGRNARIDCGLWWSAPKCPLAAIVYCSFFDEPKSLLGFKHDEDTKGIEAFRYHGRTILYSSIPRDLAIEPVLNYQLTFLLKHLK